MGDEFLSAVQNGELEIVRELLGRDPALVQTRSSEGVSPLLLARYHGHDDVFAALLEASAELDIFEASAAGRLDRVRAIVASDPARADAYSADGWTPLHLAAFWGYREVALALLDGGADPSAVGRNPMANTPLHAAAAGGHRDVCRALLDRGSDPNARQHRGYTALHSAALHGDGELVELLLAAGARPGDASAEGETAAAFARKGGHEKIAGQLEAL